MAMVVKSAQLILAVMGGRQMHRDSRVSQSRPLSSCLPRICQSAGTQVPPLRAQALGDLASCSEARKNSTPAFFGSFSNCPQRQCGVQGGSLTQKVLRQASTPASEHDLVRVLRGAKSRKESTHTVDGTMQSFL